MKRKAGNAQLDSTGDSAPRAEAKSRAATKCPVWRAATALVDGMSLPPQVLNSEFDICYCGTCADLGGHDPAVKCAERGQPPKTYAFPIGWCRFGMRLPAGVTEETMDQQHVTFHGTKRNTVEAILKSQIPQLLLSGSENETGFVIPIRPRCGVPKAQA